MTVRVAPNFVSLVPHPQHKFRILLSGPSHYKEGSFHSVVSEDVQHPWGMDMIWPVINGNGYLFPIPSSMLKQLSTGKDAKEGVLNDRTPFCDGTLGGFQSILSPQIRVAVLSCDVLFERQIRSRLSARQLGQLLQGIS
jgi:hypothetical protein